MAQQIREVAASFDLNFNTASFNKADSAINKLIGGMQKLGGALAGGAVGVGFAHFIQRNLELADHIDDTSRRLGVSTDALQGFGFVAEQAGIDSETMAASLGKFNKTIGEAQMGNEKAKKSFRDLGISLHDLNTQDQTELLLRFSEGLSKQKGIARQTALAQQILGKGGTKLVGVFNQGRKAVEAQVKSLRDIGGILNKETIETLSKTEDNVQRLKLGFRGLTFQLAAEFNPALDFMASKFEQGLKWLNQFEGKASLLQATLGGLGVGVLGGLVTVFPKLLPFITRLSLLTAGFIALYAIAEDLFNLFNGNDSVIRDWFDSWKGAGAADAVVVQIKKNFKDFVDFINLPETKEAGKQFFTNLGEAAKGALEIITNMLKPIQILGTLLRGDFKEAGKLTLGLGQTFAKNLSVQVPPEMNKSLDQYVDLSVKGASAAPKDFPGFESNRFMAPEIRMMAAQQTLASAPPPAVNTNNTNNMTFNIQATDPQGVRSEVQSLLDEHFFTALQATTQAVKP